MQEDDATDEISSMVLATICDTFRCDPGQVTRATQADDIDGWDSLSHAVLLVGIEKRLGVRLDAAQALDVQNVGELIDLVRGARLAAARA